MKENPASTEDFEKLDIRVGRVTAVRPFPEGRYSTHILMIDFGQELGTPSVSTSERCLPICRGGKFTTASTGRPTSSAPA